jgi:hypothetical protein
MMSLSENIVFKELNSRVDKAGFAKAQNPENAVPTSTPVPDTIIMKAEEALLELALAHGDVGRRLSEELPNEMISNTPVGKALETVISLTVNGEWETSTKVLLNSLCDEPCPAVSRILSQPNDYHDEKGEMIRRKALTDCLIVIKKDYLDKELSSLLKDIDVCQDPEQKNLLRSKYKETRKRLTDLNKTRK